MKKRFWMISFIILTIGLLYGGTVYGAATSDLLDTNTEDMLKNQYGSKYEAPFIQNGGEVDIAAASVSIQETDITFPGKNGFDFSVTRQFNSGEISGYATGTATEKYSGTMSPDPSQRRVGYYSYTVFEYLDPSGNAYWISFDTFDAPIESANEYFMTTKDRLALTPSEDDSATPIKYFGYNNIRVTGGDIKLTRNKNKPCKSLWKIGYKDLGLTCLKYTPKANWKILKPELTYINSKKTSGNTIIHYKFYFLFQTETGEVFNCNVYYQKYSEGGHYTAWEITGTYMPKELTAEVSMNAIKHAAGFDYNLALTQKNSGKTYYFANISMPDNLDATNSLVAVSDRFGNLIRYHSVYSDGMSVTDSMGREILVYPNGVFLKVNGKNKAIVEYNCKKVQNDTDPNGSLPYEYHYEYSVIKHVADNMAPEVTKYTIGERPFSDGGRVLYGTQYLLHEIIYPTGAFKKFDYSPTANMTKFVPIPYMESLRYQIHSVIGEKLTADGNSSASEYTYTFRSARNGIDAAVVKQTATGAPAVNTKYTYDIYDRLTQVATEYSDGTPKTVKELGYNVSIPDPYDFDSLSTGRLREIRRAPVRNTTLCQNAGLGKAGSVILSSENTQYNDAHQLLYRGTGEMTETNTYGDNGILLRSEIDKTADTKTVTVNTLTADKKSIASTVISEVKNNVTQGSTQTDYTYNPDGTVASEQVTANGQTINKTYAYSYSSGGSSSVTETVVNSDGAAVITVKEFDIYGHPSAVTDANGNRTQITCDLQGRQIEQLTPGGAQTTIDYDTPNNVVTVTNANGDKMKIMYTALGSLKERQIYDHAKGTWQTIDRYIYDGKNRNTQKIIMSTPTATEKYTYDGMDRVTRRTLLENGTEKQASSYTYRYDQTISLQAGAAKSKSVSIAGTGYKKAMIVCRSLAGDSYQGTNTVNFSLDSKTTLLGNLYEGAIASVTVNVEGVQTISVTAKRACDIYIGFTTDDSANFAGANLTTTTTTTGDSYYTPPKTETVTNAVGQTLTETSYTGNTSTVNNKASYQYDYQGNVLQTKAGRVAMQNLASYSTKTEYNYLGLPVKEYVADGRYVTKTYDQLGRMLTQTDPMGNTTTYEYDKLGRVLRITAPFDATGITETLNTYDKNGNVIKTQVKNSKPGEATTYSTTEYEYDSMNRVTCAIAHNGAQKIYTQYAYDPVGNMIKTVTGQTAKISDLNGTLPDNAAVTSYEYDALGNVTKVTDALGQSVTTEYNAVGLPTKSTDRNGVVTTTSYNAYGSPTVIKTGSLTQTNTYNKNNLLVQTTNGTDTISYAYDSLGRLTKETNGDIIKSYTNDTDGNRTAFTLTNGGATEMSATYTYDKTNRLTGVSYPKVVTTAYTYNDNDLLVKEMRDNLVVDYIYNNAGLMMRKSNTMAGTRLETYTYAYTYDGKQTKKEVGIANGNGSTTSITQYAYDQLGQLISESNSQLSRQYTYDSRGNRTSMIADGMTTNYSYDKNNRLTQTNTNGAIVSYNYDNNGNLYSKLYSSITPATADEESVSLEPFGQAQAAPMSLAMEQPELTIEEVAAIMEQEPGKTIKDILAERRPMRLAARAPQKTSEFFTYNERGQLTDYTDGTTTASYTYGADGYRKTKTVNGSLTEHIWDGDQVIMEDGDVYTKYYRSGSELLMCNTHQWLGKCTYFTDGHGNITRMTSRDFEATNPVGALMEDYEYDAYGNQQKDLVRMVNSPFQYCGEYYDEETGMTYLRARYYDPSIGRFISEDPVKDGMNWYVYCANDPVNMIDPMGLIPTPREAAEMAEHIYHYDQYSDIEDRSIKLDGVATGWRLIDVFTGGENDGLKMGVYVRGDEYSLANTPYEGNLEYALVNRGTSVWFNEDGSLSVEGKNNILQPVGMSQNMKDSIAHAKYFVEHHWDDEVTFIGHSKGGAEATANAVRLNKNCINFNPAFPNLWAYGLGKYEKSYSASMTHYVVKGEILNNLFGAPGIGETKYLPTKIPINAWTTEAWDQRSANHHMKVVQEVLREEGYR